MEDKVKMAMEHLVAAVCLRAKGMTAPERIAKVRELAAESKDDAAFIQTHFPELYHEAFPPSKRSRGVSRGSGWQPALCAKP